MQLLLQKLRNLVGITISVPAAPSNYVVTPTSEIVGAAQLMRSSGQIAVEDSSGHKCVRIRHSEQIPVVGKRVDEPRGDSGDEYAIALDDESVRSDDEPLQAAVPENGDPALVPRPIFKDNAILEKKKRKAARMYENAVKWSFKLSHGIAMPHNGWMAVLERCVCTCKYFGKFAILAHVITGQDTRKMGKVGITGSSRLRL